MSGYELDWADALVLDFDSSVRYMQKMHDEAAHSKSADGRDFAQRQGAATSNYLAGMDWALRKVGGWGGNWEPGPDCTLPERLVSAMLAARKAGVDIAKEENP